MKFELYNEGIKLTVDDQGCHYTNRFGDVIFENPTVLAMPFSDDLAMVQMNGHVCYINKQGRVELELDETWAEGRPFMEGYAAVRNHQGLWGYIDKEGKIWIEPKYDMALELKDYIAKVAKNKKIFEVSIWDLTVEQDAWEATRHLCFEDVAAAGPKVTGPLPHVLTAHICENGLVEVLTDDGETRMMNMAGEYVSAPAEQEGLYPFKEDGKYGYKDAAGNVVVKPRYMTARYFSNGCALAKVDADHPWDGLNAKGKLMFFAGYAEARGFVNGIMLVKSYEGLWGAVDRKGRLVVDCMYDDLSYFSKEGYAKYWIGDEFGLVTKRGDRLPFEGCMELEVDRWGAAGQSEEDREWRYYNHIGDVWGYRHWRDMFPESEGLLAVDDGWKMGYINTWGQVHLEPRWDNAQSFCNGMAPVELDGKQYFINTKGEVLAEYEWDEVDILKPGLMKTYKDGKIYLVDYRREHPTLTLPKLKNIRQDVFSTMYDEPIFKAKLQGACYREEWLVDDAEEAAPVVADYIELLEWKYNLHQVGEKVLYQDDESKNSVIWLRHNEPGRTVPFTFWDDRNKESKEQADVLIHIVQDSDEWNVWVYYGKDFEVLV